MGQPGGYPRRKRPAPGGRHPRMSAGRPPSPANDNAAPRSLRLKQAMGFVALIALAVAVIALRVTG